MTTRPSHRPSPRCLIVPVPLFRFLLLSQLFPSKRIASDGRPIEVTDTPAGLSESTGIRNSIVQPVMRRDLERAGTEIYALPQYKLTSTMRTATASRRRSAVSRTILQLSSRR